MNVQLFYVPFLVIYFRSIVVYSDNHSKESEALFRRLFKLRRVEQLAAVKRIKSLDTEEKQKKMIITAADKIFTMIRNNRVILENSEFIPGVSKFPIDEHMRDALSNTLENTALISDIILRLPDISQSLLSSHNDWRVLLAWGLQFSNETKLLDQQTSTLIDLVSQEMNFTSRSDDYINPYRKSHLLKKEMYTNATAPVLTKKKKKIKEKTRGPRMSSRDTGEL